MQINMTNTYVGTSGYKYDDWKGTFAPADCSDYQLLTHYINEGRFNFIELTYTFYRVPTVESIKGILDRAGKNVKFSIRLHKSLLKKNRTAETMREFTAGIQPIIDAGQLAAVFGDFHYTFSASKENFNHIVDIKNDFTYAPFFAELHNRTWWKERFFEEFREKNVGLVVLDMPMIRGMAPYHPVSTNNNVYFRLYGRSPMWLTPEDRFLNYRYSVREMNQFMLDAHNHSTLAQNIFFSFCNVEKGGAPKDARIFSDMVRKKYETQ